MTAPRLSLRIDLPNGTRFGPGKAALLSTLIETGSIRAAAERLKMSYPRALKLIEQMNDSFDAPLVETKHGGADGGGTHVTAQGRDVLGLYEAICQAAEAASTEAFQKLSRYIRD
ncbi:MAG: winged helix-turn-helix domain-containing protein [Henriciella sp.]